MERAATVPSFGDLLRTFARIGCLSFGGPAGQIALMHREIVEERGWLSEDQFLHALNFCHLLPGPEAQQLATWIGWRWHGVRGGLAAGMLFVIPGALVILALSIFYSFAAGLGWFAALFLGIKAAVLAIVGRALLRIARRSLNTPLKRGIAAAVFAALFLFNLRFPLVVLGAGALGFAVAALRPEWLRLGADGAAPADAPRPWGTTARAIAIGGAVWAAPLAAVLATLGPDHVLWQSGLFFARMAVVSFGGAYAVLTYVAQAAVGHYHWLAPGEMADGLGLAETTPGPLILVTQFVGYLAAYRSPAPFTPLVAGVIGAGLTTWVTFAPSFLWIFAFAPWIERLQHARRLKGALSAVTAGIVGVIGNLAAWFALHLLFTRTEARWIGALPVDVPQWDSFDWRAALLATLAAVLIAQTRWNVIAVLSVTAIAGLALYQGILLVG